MLTNPKWDYLKWVILAAVIFVAYLWWFQPPDPLSGAPTRVMQFFSAACIGYYTLILMRFKGKAKQEVK